MIEDYSYEGREPWTVKKAIKHFRWFLWDIFEGCMLWLMKHEILTIIISSLIGTLLGWLIVAAGTVMSELM